MPMKIAKILPLLTGYRKSYSVGLIQIAYFGNTLKKTVLWFCSAFHYLHAWSRLGLEVLSNLLNRDTNGAEPCACITVVLYYSGRDSISLASFELREMTTYRGVHILRKEVHKFSIAVTKRIVHNRAVSILWRKEFYRLGILGTKSNAHNGEVTPF